tara:strand:+ start:793 stop:1170 length:378 start_codon:yes stop_codon:yes gene_type:complete
MKYIFYLFFLNIIFHETRGEEVSLKKMKVQILPPDRTSFESSRYLLNKLTNTLKDPYLIKDIPGLKDIKPETIKGSLKKIPIARVKIPIDCESIGSCDQNKILSELSRFLEIDPSRLRVNIFSKP